jgi:hypothetical protein
MTWFYDQQNGDPHTKPADTWPEEETNKQTEIYIKNFKILMVVIMKITLF